MNLIKKRWFIPLIFVIVGVSAAGLYIVSLFEEEEYLSSDEITSRLEQMYEGTVDKIDEKKDFYIAEMTRAGAVYAVEVDAVDGNVLSMKHLRDVEEVTAIVDEVISEEEEQEPVVEESEQPVAPEENVIPASEEAPASQVSISKEEAIEIAFTQLRGDVESFEFENTSDGGFYLIEIEQDNDDGDDYEAIIQVHAITGEVMSVKWDN